MADKKQRDVYVQLDALDESLDKLEKIVVSFQEKLEPVLRSADPPDEVEKAEEDEVCIISRRIRQMRQRIRAVSVNLEDKLSRLEV